MKFNKNRTINKKKKALKVLVSLTFKYLDPVKTKCFGILHFDYYNNKNSHEVTMEKLFKYIVTVI